MLKTVTLAAALVAGAASLTATPLAMAQNGPGGANGNNGMPPSGYQGPGGYPSYKSSDFRLPSNASNTMPPQGYQGPAGYPSYKSSDFQQGNPAPNAAASAGYGTPQTAPRYGQTRIGQRHLYAYQPYECRRLRLEGRYLPRSCR
jgi:hypothetical protein